MTANTYITLPYVDFTPPLRGSQNRFSGFGGGKSMRSIEFVPPPEMPSISGSPARGERPSAGMMVEVVLP
jgi:hypothetical protein